MKVEHFVNVDLEQMVEYPLLTMKQFDSGNIVHFNVTKNGNSILPTHDTIRIYIKKPDRTKVYQELEIDDDGTVKMGVTNQALAIPGIAMAELEFTTFGTTEIITSPIFKIKIMPTNVDDSAIESSDEFTALEEALKKIDQNSIKKIKEDISTLFEIKLEKGDKISKLENDAGYSTTEAVQALFEPLNKRVSKLEERDIKAKLSENTLKIYLKEDT